MSVDHIRYDILVQQALRDMVRGGGQVQLVQVHSIARPPAQHTASALKRGPTSIARLSRVIVIH